MHALPFILATIDAGTRVARFLVQELFGRVHEPWGRADWMPGTLAATGLVVGGWTAFLWTGSISTIWPLFGIANQLLASIALVIGTTLIVRMGRARQAWITLLPLSFVATTTVTAAVESIFQNFLPMAGQGHPVAAYLDSLLTVIMVLGLFGMLVLGVRIWLRPDHWKAATATLRLPGTVPEA